MNKFTFSKIMHNFLKFVNKKKFKHGGLSILLTAVFIAAVVIINIIAGLILDRFDTAIDLSADRIFSIDESTANVLNELTDTVTITVTSREGDFIAMNRYNEQINEILKRFSGTNSNITLNYIDLMQNPNFAAKYEGLSADSIIVESVGTGRHKVLDSSQYLEFVVNGNRVSEQEYNLYRHFYGSADADEFATAESALLTAVMSITDVNPINIAFTTGYGETQNTQMELILESYAYNILSVHMVTDSIADDTDLVFINSPQTDYSTDTLKALDTWLSNDGKFGRTLIYIAHSFAETPNIDSFLNDWGIEVERGYVGQTDASFVAPEPGQGGRIVQYFEPFNFNEGLNPSYRIFGTVMRSVKQTFEEQSRWNMETEAILSSFDGAVVVPFDRMNSDSDNDNDEDSEDEWSLDTAERGEFSVGVISQKSPVETLDSEVIMSNLVVFGGDNVFAAEFLSMQNANNAEFFINMMNSLSGKDDGFIPTLTHKSFTIPTFQITQEQSSSIGVVFVFVLPLLIIGTGVVVWIRRIRR